MTQPWTTIDQVETDEGPMTLMRRGEDEYIIRMEHFILMSSRYHRSEAALGSLACDALGKRPEARVLVAGLGMGFTLRAVLDGLGPDACVTVAELNPAVIEWCKGPLAELTDRASEDPRVRVKLADVAHEIAAAAGRSQPFDAIVLDLYQGTDDANADPAHPVYGRAALEVIRAALKPAGVFAVWTEDPDPRFEKRLEKVGFAVERHRAGKGGPRYVVYLATRAEAPPRRRKPRQRHRK